MKKVKKMYCGGFYIIKSRSAANMAYFENKKDIVAFMKLLNRNFRGVLKLYHFLLNQEGWICAVKVEDEPSINAQCLRIFDKTRMEIVSIPTWRKISELMRISLSQYVRNSNREKGKTGVRVHSSYERYIFRTKGEAMAYLIKLKRGMICQAQRRKRYRSSKKHYTRLIELGKASLFLSSRKLRKRRNRRHEVARIMRYIIDFQCIKMDVVDNWMEATTKLHSSPHPHP